MGKEKEQSWLAKLFPSDAAIEGSPFYQYTLIGLIGASTLLLGVFFIREVDPPYKEYQRRFVDIEELRAEMNGEEVAPFKYGIKQILMKEGKGVETIDRCTTCHVALDISDYAARIPYLDLEGKTITDAEGKLVLVDNPRYFWGLLEEKIQNLQKEERLAEAENLSALFWVEEGGHRYDARKVLSAHPLIGTETRPFELHPVDQFGCTSCHSGNGRALTIKKAHGPVKDGEYTTAHTGFTPQFLEKDESDPPISKWYNDKPGDALLFQTTPLLLGKTIEARCAECHLTTQSAFIQNELSEKDFVEKLDREIARLDKNLKEAKSNFLQIEELLIEFKKGSWESLQKTYQANLENALLTPKENIFARQVLVRMEESGSKEKMLTLLETEKNAFFKSKKNTTPILNMETLDKALFEEGASGILVDLEKRYEFLKMLKAHGVNPQEITLGNVLVDTADLNLETYQRGERLFFEQACYGCHRIAGVSRGGVGPELTEEGKSYPWFVKESIVWPQADLKNSQMPNYRLDHPEIEALLTYLFGQRKMESWRSKQQQTVAIRDWEAGKTTWIEAPLKGEQKDLFKEGQYVFATQGCASCHRLKGFESEIGFKGEEDTPLYLSSFFKDSIPENITGSKLIAFLKEHHLFLEKHLDLHKQEPQLLDKLHQKDPRFLLSFYPNFAFAERVLGSEAAQGDKQAKAALPLVHPLLMLYIEEYGFGRLVGPQPNFSGIYRSDRWLMEHFWNPQGYVARSLMPVMPFNESKFWALTHMLDQMGVLNRDAIRTLWQEEGFDPEEVYQTLCASCHGEGRQGNGPVAEWIYPIPKNLADPRFMYGLSKEQAVEAILHGVKGSSMPPWGETFIHKGKEFGTPVLTKQEAGALAEWLYTLLPGSDHPSLSVRWRYGLKEMLEDLEAEKSLETPSSFFEKRPIPSEGTEGVFIKPDFYTPYHLEQGEALYQLHCSVCHGKEGDGAGPRSEAMVEAKPRMLTNVDWLASRDDRRLLSSIKYGVPGTAMHGWGEMTTALQRMEMVAYIRSLSLEQQARKRVRQEIFNHFVVSERALKTAQESKRDEVLIEALKTTSESAMQLGGALARDPLFGALLEEFIIYLSALPRWEDSLETVTLNPGDPKKLLQAEESMEKAVADGKKGEYAEKWEKMGVEVSHFFAEMERLAPFKKEAE